MTSDLVAWQGPCELLEAKWNDRDGTMVKFRLVEVDEASRNPFVTFTKRRKGRAGTRFSAKMVPTERPDLLVYNDEAMLAGWGDSQNGGMTVTFWLAEDRLGHPFTGWARHTEFVVVLVELDEAEEPVNQKVRAKVEAASEKPSARLSYSAAMLCRQPQFWQWLNEELSIEPIEGEVDAAEFVRNSLKINSRGVLDTDQRAAELYRRRILVPYEEWLEGKNGRRYQ